MCIDSDQYIAYYAISSYRYNTSTMSVYSRRKYTWTGCVCVVVCVGVSECEWVSEWVCLCDTPCVVCASHSSLSLSLTHTHTQTHTHTHTHTHTLNPEHKPITSDEWDTPMKHWAKANITLVSSRTPPALNATNSHGDLLSILQKNIHYEFNHSTSFIQFVSSTWMPCPKKLDACNIVFYW
jgi:hypothetical protein